VNGLGGEKRALGEELLCEISIKVSSATLERARPISVIRPCAGEKFPAEQRHRYVDAGRCGRKAKGAVEDIGGSLDAGGIARGVEHHALGLSEGVVTCAWALRSICAGVRGAERP
jgi:hypothetical protein